MSKFLTPLLALAFILPFPAVAEDQELAGLFSALGVKGTIVLSSLRGGETIIHNELRANQPFSPASTFKILNTLISLEEQVIAGKDDVLKWNGQIHDMPDWNHDQTLESAFKTSCVWCFQELARRVGAEKYQMYLHEYAYGELRDPFEETTFWLDGSLTISAIGQVEFLGKVNSSAPPFSASSYETLRDIMLVEKAHTFTLWAKTGWATRQHPQVGWYVGYVETPEDIWLFATNIDIRDEKDLPLRLKLTREAFKIKGIIE